jgi:lysozyme family protein
VSAAAFTTLDIANLGDADIAAIRRVRYWGPLCCDSFPAPIAIFVADEGYNQGNGAAVRDLQTAAGTGSDGVLGPATIAAVQRRGNDLDGLLTELIAARAWRYAQLAKVQMFGRGWMRRLAIAATAAYRFS